MPPAAITGTCNLSARRGNSANNPLICNSALAASNAPRCPPASMPCAITASAPAACACRASSSVVAQANQAMFAAFNRCTCAAENTPMMVEATAGRAWISASNWASKSAGPASPAVTGTCGPHCPRKSRVAASAAASRRGAGSGTHRLICAGPCDCALKASIHCPICSGVDNTAPIAPMPPALASAADNGTGQAPAIGDNRIGRPTPKRWQKASTRCLMMRFIGRTDSDFGCMLRSASSALRRGSPTTTPLQQITRALLDTLR
ncbi:hypothetical protein D3C71_1329670 [compost metagenome]